jgi:hypothetical protein
MIRRALLAPVEQAHAAIVRREIASMRPRDMIDLQSFPWVQDSDEYPD